MAAVLDFKSIPAVEGQPRGNAWKLWGSDDGVGTLNYLTPSVVLEAAKEIKLGKSVQLDARLDQFEQAYAGREGFQHTIIDYKGDNPGGLNFYGHDDVLRFNTQGSSQWDGLRHVGIQESGLYYNGVRHEDMKKGGKLGTHKRGGIVGRGVLLDYHRWRAESGKPPAPVTETFAITVEELDQVARSQNVSLRLGDILIIRSGFMHWYRRASSEQRAKAMERNKFIGVEPSQQTVEWFWNHHFAAVAGDMMGFETVPTNMGEKDKVFMHEWFLNHWGTLIGELWDLETLSRSCADAQKWSFFLTSAPLHVVGGVASPPNAIAIL
ncbi:hypothetical protein H2204_000415 [Knufia peltigerae]|uniref:Cyclase n=1 Tax=Knufia peltigerae TaxID=1002370 RepID=A0AA38YEL5_9EURO|nr:hypothetical protein H2204_000415 [Knufia peltigerae]